jgi:hypothetical protein
MTHPRPAPAVPARTVLAATLLVALVVPGVLAAAPQVEVILPIGSDFITPGKTEAIDGQVIIHFPQDADCGAGLAYGFAVANHTAGLSIRLLTPNGTLPAAQIRPGENATLANRVELEVSPDVVAYTDVVGQVRAATEACGSLQASAGTGQVGARVAFLPSVELRVEREQANSWRIHAENHGNAKVRVDWRTRQPSLGRLLAGGSTTVPGPESGTNRSGEFLVSRTGVDESASVVLEAQLIYQGDHPYRPDERPATGSATLVVYEPPSILSPKSSMFQYVLLGGALLLIAAGVAGTWWLRRRKPKP